jgi:predicted amidohydrolase YtcJ
MAARRALLLEPYSDDPTTLGKQYTTLDDLAAQMSAADRAGFQIAVHAIGDRANRIALEAIERVGNLKRPRIEHTQLVHPQDWPKFGRLGVIASMQPVHCVQDLRWLRDRIGEGRLRGAYAWKSLKRNGAVLAFGSDVPVETADPFVGIQAAVTRRSDRGEVLTPDERLTVEEAIRAYTIDAAYAGFEERHKGSLEPGKWADFIVLSQDPTSIPPSDIRKTTVLLTVVGGREVYRE